MPDMSAFGLNVSRLQGTVQAGLEVAVLPHQEVILSNRNPDQWLLSRVTDTLLKGADGGLKLRAIEDSSAEDAECAEQFWMLHPDGHRLPAAHREAAHRAPLGCSETLINQREEVFDDIALDLDALLPQAAEEQRDRGLTWAELGRPAEAADDLAAYLAARPDADDAHNQQDLEHSETARALTISVLSIAKSLHMTVVAEGVENEAQERAVKAMGCDEVQGFMYAKPMTAVDLVKFLAKS